MCLWASYKKKICKKIFFFASLKSMKEGVGPGVGFGSIKSIRGSGSGSAPKCYGSPTLFLNVVFFRAGFEGLVDPDLQRGFNQSLVELGRWITR